MNRYLGQTRSATQKKKNLIDAENKNTVFEFLFSFYIKHHSPFDSSSMGAKWSFSVCFIACSIRCLLSRIEPASELLS